MSGSDKFRVIATAKMHGKGTLSKEFLYIVEPDAETLRGLKTQMRNDYDGVYNSNGAAVDLTVRRVS